MIASEIHEDCGPNVSDDASNFFQSDRDLAKQNAKDSKRIRHALTGSPISLPSKVLDVQFASDPDQTGPSKGHVYAYVAESGHVARKYNLVTGKWTKAYKGHTGPVTSIAVAVNAAGEDAVIVTASWDKTVRKWNAQTGESLMKLTGHKDFVKKVIIHDNNIISGSADTTVKMWDLNTGRLLRTFKDHSRGVEDILVFEGGTKLASASSDGSIKIWDMGAGTVLATLKGHLTSVYKLAMSEEGDLWSASADKTLKRWDLNTELEDTSLEHPDFVKAVAVSGRYVFTGCRDENVRVWDTASDKVVRVMNAHSDEVSVIALRGSVVWSGSIDCTIRRWDVSDLVGGTKEEDLFGVLTSTDDPTIDSTFPSTVGGSGLTNDEEAELADLMAE
ncbi:hypothetical protein SeLEV6574_g07184 [Synchytrium endobioticum]|nr:hypothetical protein SeLEV6574_g07184 [Synchytrium endobioticum]